MRVRYMFYKIKTLNLPEYLFCLNPSDQHPYNTHNLDFAETYYYRTDAFKYSFFPYVISEWKKFDSDLRNAKSYLLFRKSLPKLGPFKANLVYNIRDVLGINIHQTIDNSNLNINDGNLVKTLLFNNCKFTLEIVSSFRETSNNYIKSFERYDK